MLDSCLTLIKEENILKLFIIIFHIDKKDVLITFRVDDNIYVEKQQFSHFCEWRQVYARGTKLHSNFFYR